MQARTLLLASPILLALLVPVAAAQDETPLPSCSPTEVVSEAVFVADGNMSADPEALAMDAGSQVQAVVEVTSECAGAVVLVVAEATGNVTVVADRDVELTTDASGLVYLNVTLPPCAVELQLLAAAHAGAAVDMVEDAAAGDATAHVAVVAALELGLGCEGTPPPPPPPPCPDVAIVSTDAGIHLELNASLSVDAFVVYRAEAGGNLTPVAQLDGNATAHLDVDVDAEVTYTYVVTAVVDGQESEDCEPDEGTAIPYFGHLGALAAGILGVAGYVVVRRRK